MKKFTQIFSRKRQGVEGESLAKSSRRPVPEFHQLSSGRVHLYNGSANGSGRHVSQRTAAATSLIVVDDSEKYCVCETCEYIDFASVLDWHPGLSRPWISLSHTLGPQGGARARAVKEEVEDEVDENGESFQPRMAPKPAAKDDNRTCPYCLFFRTLVGGAVAADGTGKYTPYLRIRRAFERFGGGEKDALGSEVLVEVMTRNKALPWGYVVRSADDDADWEAYTGANTAPGAGAVLRGRAVTPLLNPALPRAWIDFCCTNHSDTNGCARQRPLVHGLRLVDCETRCIVLAEDIGDPGLEYVTLSYVWGEQGQIDAALSLSGGEEMQTLPDIMPRLIDDAVSITQSLGFRFLWVDRYCFFQGLGEPERRRQVELMGEIYAQSAVTLVAAGAEGVDSGIHGVSVERQPQLSLKTETGGHFTTTLLRPDLEVASSPWGSRAWTFQEGLLARRRLVFTPSQIYFQCRSLHCHETLSLPLPLATGLNLGRVFPEHGAGAGSAHLSTQIRDYMPRSLSKPGERLDAFRGILHHYSNLPYGVHHFLGLPLFHPSSAFSPDRIVSQTDRLAVGLGWMARHSVPSASGKGHYVDPYILDEESWDSDGSLFPSWTWLAWKLRPDQGPSNHSFHINLLEEPQPHASSTTTIPSSSSSSKQDPHSSATALSASTANDATATLGTVRAPPRMEISVGFADGALLSWEIDGDAITAKSDRVTHLHLKTYCFDLRIRKDAEQPPKTGPSQKLGMSMEDVPAEHIIVGSRHAGLADASDEEDDDYINIEYPNLSKTNKDTLRSWFREGVPEGLHGLVGVLLYGRHWYSANASTNGESSSDHHPNGHSKGSAAHKNRDGNVATALVCARSGWQKDGHLRRLGVLAISFRDFTPVDESEALMQGIPMDGGWMGNLPVQLREVDIY